MGSCYNKKLCSSVKRRGSLDDNGRDTDRLQYATLAARYGAHNSR
jgi:hypothetical protein